MVPPFLGKGFGYAIGLHEGDEREGGGHRSERSEVCHRKGGHVEPRQSGGNAAHHLNAHIFEMAKLHGEDAQYHHCEGARDPRCPAAQDKKQGEGGHRQHQRRQVGFTHGTCRIGRQHMQLGAPFSFDAEDARQLVQDR